MRSDVSRSDDLGWVTCLARAVMNTPMVKRIRRMVRDPGAEWPISHMIPVYSRR